MHPVLKLIQPRAQVTSVAGQTPLVLDSPHSGTVYPDDFRPVCDLATLRRAAVLELPFYYERSDYPRHAAYMSASGWHWQPLINGYSDHIPLEFRDLAPRMHGFPSRESFAELRQRRARYVVMHLNLYGRRDRERMLERLTAYSAYLTLLNDDGTIRLYEVTAWPQ